jgi:uncharacterized membrane protein (DUF485 family)
MIKIFLKDKLNNLIPSFAIGIGIFFTLLTFIIQPKLLPINNFISAIIFGFLCGLASIGWHQVLTKIYEEICLKKYDNYPEKTNNKRKKRNTEQVITLKEFNFDKSNQKRTINEKKDNK